MTATTDTPTELKIPSWIDLDQIISPELRAEARAEAEQMKDFLTECRTRAARYHSILDRTQERLEESRVHDVDPDYTGLCAAIRRETGIEDLVEVGWLVGLMFSPDPNSTPNEDYVAEIAERHGVLKLMVSAVTGNEAAQS